jgi:hypothetical protein
VLRLRFHESSEDDAQVQTQTISLNTSCPASEHQTPAARPLWAGRRGRLGNLLPAGAHHLGASGQSCWCFLRRLLALTANEQEKF